MTRLQKDAWRNLAVLVLAALVVGVAYLLTGNWIHSLCWLGLIGFLGILAMFPTVVPGPVIEREDFPVRPRLKIWRIILLVLVWSVVQGVFLVAYTQRNFIMWTPSIICALLAVLIIWRNWSAARLKYRLPKYDEREVLVQKNAVRIAFAIFWLAFVFWSVAAGILSDNGVWHLPGCVYGFQVMVGYWLFQTVYSIAVIWQERRAGA